MIIKPRTTKNDPRHPDSPASKRSWINGKRYSVQAVNTTGNALEWRLEDWDKCDELGYPTILIKTPYWDNVISFYEGI